MRIAAQASLVGGQFHVTAFTKDSTSPPRGGEVESLVKAVSYAEDEEKSEPVDFVDGGSPFLILAYTGIEKQAELVVSACR